MDPARIEIHYTSTIGYWCKINGQDAGIYAGSWARLCDDLAAQLKAYNILHGEPPVEIGQQP